MKRGFSLVEVMFILAILGLLAAVSIPVVQKARINRASPEWIARENVIKEIKNNKNDALKEIRNHEFCYSCSNLVSAVCSGCGEELKKAK